MPCQRETQRPKQSVEVRKWLQGVVWENREAFEAGQPQAASQALSAWGSCGGARKGYCSLPKQAMLHACSPQTLSGH